ncbi:MAG TPA: hypothetical protein VK879_13005 [Candidatus Sulfomarinibacteraceae bacterium]|nr:hypothetical protein [Candidatus Sulfomarinibacteraceae bacterium]
MSQQEKQKRSKSSRHRKVRATATGVSAADVRRLVAKLKGEDAKE